MLSLEDWKRRGFIAQIKKPFQTSISNNEYCVHLGEKNQPYGYFKMNPLYWDDLTQLFSKYQYTLVTYHSYQNMGYRDFQMDYIFIDVNHNPYNLCFNYGQDRCIIDLHYYDPPQSEVSLLVSNLNVCFIEEIKAFEQSKENMRLRFITNNYSFIIDDFEEY